MTESEMDGGGLSRRQAIHAIIGGISVLIVGQSVVGCGGSGGGGGGGAAPAPSNPPTGGGGGGTQITTMSLKQHLENQYDIGFGSGVKSSLITRVSSKQNGGVLALNTIMVFKLENSQLKPFDNQVDSITVKTGDTIVIGETNTDATKPAPDPSNPTSADLENYVFVQGQYNSNVA